MNAPETVDESSSPYQNGPAARRRRRQKAGDETEAKGQNKPSETRQPLLALEAARSETESDDDPASSSPRRYTPRPPLSADVEFAPSLRGANGKPTRAYPERQGSGPVPGRGAETITPRPGSTNTAHPSRQATQPSAGRDLPSPADESNSGSGQPEGEDDQLASYPPPPPFEEVLASEGYSYPRSPDRPDGNSDSSALHSPSLTPPPPPHVPPSPTDLFGQGSLDRQFPAGPDSSGQGTGHFPPPPVESPVSERQPESSPYTLAHKQSGSRPTSTANTVPKSSLHQDRSADRPLSSSFEDDNDRSLRRQRNTDNNMYVNVDNIVGKETYF